MTMGPGGFPGGARAGQQRQARWQDPGLAAKAGAGEGHADGCAPGHPGGETCCQGDQESGQGAAGSPDSRLLRKTLALIEPQSEKFMAHFFATLFVRNPELRPMFPLALGETRKRVFETLTRCAWAFDQPGTLSRWLGELGRDHRKFGVTEQHYRSFCAAFLATVQAFCAGCWSPQAQAAWERALDAIATAMAAGGQPGAGSAGGAAAPGWWLAEVAAHDLRCPDLAVLTLRPDQPLPYLAGQHVSVQVPHWPRVWREYSVANAPAPDGLLRLHVRAVPGGGVSTTLVHRTRPGDTVILGRARGAMTAAAIGSSRVVCVAGGTGLAPVKAIAEALTSPARPHPQPAVRLFFGARTRAGLYDLADLRRLAGSRPSLTVIPVVTGDRGGAGGLAETAAAHLLPATKDVVISGPPGMVAATVALVAARAPAARLHADPLPGAAMIGP